MVRMACVDLPAFPLQILLKRRPEWRDQAAAVVDEDRPQGMLLWVNERARAGRILPGMRYAGALSLVRDLRAAVIAPAEIQAEVKALSERLRFFSPEVECAHDEPGTFWLGAEGLELLHPQFSSWAELIRADLRQMEYDGRIAVGFSRFGCYATARSGLKTAVFNDREEERVAVRRISMDRIACDADFRDTLARLGIFELGGFLDLPPSGIRRRFGEAAFALHRMAHGETWAPLAPEIPEEPHERTIVLDHPETDTARLLHAIEEDLDALLRRLRTRDRALCGLTIEITFDRPAPAHGGMANGSRRRLETLRPAIPTCDLDLLRDLLRLRLESIEFPSGVVDVRIRAEFVGNVPEQMTLFPKQRCRDLEAANRALARVRAEFGDGSVCAVRLIEAHLPEAKVALDPMAKLVPAQPRIVRLAPVLRRLLLSPRPIALCPACASSRGGHPQGMILRGQGPVVEAVGPFIVSGGWWRREVVRHYWYVRIDCGPVETGCPGADSGTARAAIPTPGTWLWIYRDARRLRWFQQGGVE